MARLLTEAETRGMMTPCRVFLQVKQHGIVYAPVGVEATQANGQALMFGGGGYVWEDYGQTWRVWDEKPTPADQKRVGW